MQRNRYSKIISPTALALLSIVPLGLAYCVPIETYQYYVVERDYIWSTPKMPMFYIGCIVMFLIGTKSIDLYRRPSSYRPRERRYHDPQIIILVLSGIIALNLISAVALMRENPNLISNLFSGMGQLTKYTMQASNAMTSAQPLLQASCIWALFRFLQMHENISSPGMKWLLGFEIAAAIFLSLSISLLKVARFEMVPLITGLLIVFAYNSKNTKPLTFGRILLILAAFGILMVAVFLLLSILRGNGLGPLLIAALFGYSITNFNHLCAMLNGTLQFPLGGHGAYAFGFLSDLPILHNSLADFFNIPNSQFVFLSEFKATGNAGLNGAFIWLTAFGYLYADLGYYALIYMGVLGIIVTLAWRSFQDANTIGIVIYPYFAASIFLWFTFQMIARPEMTVMLIFSLILHGVESFEPAMDSKVATR